MSSSGSDISQAGDSSSDNSGFNYALEAEEDQDQDVFAGAEAMGAQYDPSGYEEGPHNFDPIADDEFLFNYEREVADREEADRQLQRRFDGTEPLVSWCKCGRCSLEELSNAKECKCCTEIESCMVAINDAEVVEEVGSVVSCVTEHPGFSAVCLNKWSLRLAADKYKTRHGRRYRRAGFENDFLRSVSYRDFTRLIHGYLGHNQRIPLPACAYVAIRKKFPLVVGEKTGFREEADSE